MFRYSLSWCIFTFTLLESIIKTHLTVHDSSHGFISNNRKYFDDELSSLHGDISQLGHSPNVVDISHNLQLKFEPSFLDFKMRPLGVPHLEKVYLFNADANKSIDMTSISGSTVHFHSSFFEDKKIPPLGNTSFNVVFLGREEGEVESSLFIHTNEGHFKYDVKGSSVYSPYRLRPIVGVKLPVNCSFSPLIYMHNPHSKAVQILEVYSSGGDFHLELPTGELEGPKNMWELLPLQTKAVIRVRFQAKLEHNHSAYVRIKVNTSEDILVVPVEVAVSASGGLIHPQGLLDFGFGGSMDPPKVLNLCVRNALKKPIKIHSVTTTSKAIKIDFQNVKLQPEGKYESQCINIGTVSLDWKAAYKNQDSSGRIVIKYRNGKAQTEIPYFLTVLEGGLLFDEQVTRYFVNDTIDEMLVRNFKIKNSFDSPVKILSVTLPETVQKFFSISDFNPVFLKPREELKIFSVNLRKGVSVSDLRINSHILLKTNVSEISIPLLSYNGKLSLHLPYKNEESQLELGLLSFNSRKETKFIIYNINPVEIKIKNLKTSLPSTKVEILGCDVGNHSLALFQISYPNITKCTTLKPHEYAILILKVLTGNSDGHTIGDIHLETQYENVTIPFHYKTAAGKLEIGPDRLVFDQCFPGKFCSHPLRVHSTFSDPMLIENIVSLPPDSRLSSRHFGHILARASKIIGYLYLDPSLGCRNECYAGLQYDTTAQWLKTLSLWNTVPDFDLNLVNVFYNRYLNSTSNGMRKWQNLTLRLDTTEVRDHIFQTRVKMSWPSLLVNHDFENKSVLNFPLTQIGNVTYKNITIRNPSSFNLVVQVVLDKHYPGVQSLFEGLPTSFIPPNFQDYRKLKHSFFLLDNYLVNFYDFRDKLDLNVHRDSLPILLAPGENFTFTIGFRGADINPQSALIFLRNNLTIIEALCVTGKASYPEFKFGNRKPGAGPPLVFELTEKHLKDCEKDKNNKNSVSNLTVRRYFTARNTGEISIYVNNFFINGQPCEGNGFRVLNCAPFVLHPNATRKIDIAFTPDFTLTKVVRILTLETSLGQEVNYTLQATVPYHYLGLCSGAIPRPPWESLISLICMCMMSVLLVILLSLSCMDSSRITSQAVSAFVMPSSPCVQHTLDLKLVGQQARSEIRSVKQDSKSSPHEDKSISSKSDNSSHNCEMPQKSQDVEKTPVLIPSTGKTKKKLAKKNSNDTNTAVHSHSHADVSKKQIEVPKIQKPKPEDKHEEKQVSVPVKKHILVKKSVKSIATTCEEETSSTTTESSNNDDAEKENDHTNAKSCTKKINNNKTNNCNHSEAHTSHVQSQINNNISSKSERRRSNQKCNSQKNNRGDTQEKSEQQHKPNFENRKSHKSGRERKEKQAHNRKAASEKTKLTESKSSSDSKISGQATRISPTVSSNIWTENKASFSDVVARSDASYNRPTNQPSKPTMYVEPYKQTSTQLGPIGSRREYWQENTNEPVNRNARSNIEHTTCLSSNSLFSNAQNIPVENPQPYLGDLMGTDTWSQSPALMNILEPHMCSVREDSWNQCNTAPTNSYWNNFNLMGNNSVPVQPQQQQTPITDQTSYLWGASSVWQPWAPPEVPRTPTRTPPGFDAVIQRNRDEQQAQQVDIYSPFGTSNIWTQPETYSWDYSQQ